MQDRGTTTNELCPKYPKIQTIFVRDPQTHRVIEERWGAPEFAYLADNLWSFTEKVDGTNIRVAWNGESVNFFGRTDAAQIPPFLAVKLKEIFTPEKMDQVFDAPVSLYGEGYGARIQKGGAKYNPDGVDFALFDVLIDGWWLQRPDVEYIAELLGITPVPVVGVGALKDAAEMTKKGFKSQWGDFIAEGLVVRPMVQLFTRKGQRIIGKIKYADFARDPRRWNGRN